MKRFVFLLGALVAVSPVWAEPNVLPAPQEENGFLYFTADQAYADPNAKTINLQGNVTLTQETKDGDVRKATGENVTLDQLNTTFSSVGPMHVEGMGATLDGENISVNYKTKDYYAENIQTEYPPLRVLSAKSVSAINGTQRLKGAVLTCCDQTPPHYTIYLGNVKISPQKRVFGTNAVFRFDDVPLLWLPVYWRSLDSQKPWTTYVDFTQSNRVGFGLLSSTVFTKVPVFRPKLNLDYYTKSGVGTGLELMAIETDKLKGTGEFYFIDDKASKGETYTVDGNSFRLHDTKRWGIRGGYWWEMYDSSDHFQNSSGALYQFQTQFRKVSDPYFNDSFFRGNPYIFTPDQQTNFSLARQSRASTLRISYTQQDIFDWQRGEYMAQERTLPQLDYVLLPFKDPLLGLSHQFEVHFNNTSQMEQDWHRQGSARWTTKKSISLTRGLTFLPSVFYDQHLTLQDANYNDKDSWVGRVGTDLNLQTNTFFGTLDAGYQYTRRFSTGTIELDRVSADRGEERNRLYVQNYFRPSFNTYVKVGAGFSLVNYDGQNNSWQHLKRRIEPFLLEAGYNSPGGTINLLVQDLYDITEGNQAFVAQTNFVIKDQLLGIGVNNYDDFTDPYSLYQTFSDRYTFTTTFGLRPHNSSWNLDVGTGLQLERGHLIGFNKFVRLDKHFHDAIVELTVRDRNHNLSFALMFNILCGKQNRAQTQTQTPDQYWYPWRSENKLRDM